MNRIVRENYPVADLPEDLRDGFVENNHVRIVVESTEDSQVVGKKPFSLDELFARAPKSFQNLEEITEHIRSIREEWD